MKNGASGFTLVELLLFVALAAVVMSATLLLSLPRIARSATESAAYDVQSFMRLARAEAISRNRNSRFVVDTSLQKVFVLDSMGTVPTGDDELLHERRLPTVVGFARPDPGMPVTLTALGGSAYGVAFGSDGTVDAGGEIVLTGGDDYRKLTVFVAGGQELLRWDGSVWH